MRVCSSKGKTAGGLHFSEVMSFITSTTQLLSPGHDRWFFAPKEADLSSQDQLHGLVSVQLDSSIPALRTR